MVSGYSLYHTAPVNQSTVACLAGTLGHWLAPKFSLELALSVPVPGYPNLELEHNKLCAIVDESLWMYNLTAHVFSLSAQVWHTQRYSSIREVLISLLLIWRSMSLCHSKSVGFLAVFHSDQNFFIQRFVRVNIWSEGPKNLRKIKHSHLANVNVPYHCNICIYAAPVGDRSLLISV